jgi:hypothetical protein
MNFKLTPLEYGLGANFFGEKEWAIKTSLKLIHPLSPEN